MMASLIFFAVGFGFMYAAYAFSKKYDALVENGLRAEGIIFDFKPGGPDDADMPIIRFVTDKQEWITKTSDISLLSAKKGDCVVVLYDPENPGNFVVKSSSTYLFVSLFAIIGCLAVLGGVYSLLFTP